MDNNINNSLLINTVVTTVLLWGAVTILMVPQLNIFAPHDQADVSSSVNTWAEEAHFVAPDLNPILNIANDSKVLGINNIDPPAETKDIPQEPKQEKRIKQPGTFYRCTNPLTWRPIEHGKSITVYEKSVVRFPEECKKEVRICDNGTMLWSFVETTCKQDGDGCVWPDGKNYSHKSVGTYYLHNEVIGKPEDWEDICTRQARICQNGSWYLFDHKTKSNFTYKYAYCNVKIP